MHTVRELNKTGPDIKVPPTCSGVVECWLHVACADQTDVIAAEVEQRSSSLPDLAMQRPCLDVQMPPTYYKYCITRKVES